MSKKEAAPKETPWQFTRNPKPFRFRGGMPEFMSNADALRAVNRTPAFEAMVEKVLPLLERLHHREHGRWCDTPDDSRGQSEGCRELSEAIESVKLAQESKEGDRG